MFKVKIMRKQVTEMMEWITGARPSAGLISIEKSIFARLKRPSITFGSGKNSRNSSCKVQKNQVRSSIISTTATRILIADTFNTN